MSMLEWDKDGERKYKTGVDRVALYPKTGVNGAYANGVAWNGVTAINESTSGGEPSPFYADNIKYANILSDEQFAFTIEAFWYPDEFAVCDGSAEVATGVRLKQQKRKPLTMAIPLMLFIMLWPHPLMSAIAPLTSLRILRHSLGNAARPPLRSMAISLRRMLRLIAQR